MSLTKEDLERLQTLIDKKIIDANLTKDSQDNSFTYDIQSIRIELEFMAKENARLHRDLQQKHSEITRRIDNQFMLLTLGLVITVTVIAALF